MTVKELLGKMCDASDADEKHVAVYRPSLLGVSVKRGLLTIRLAVKTDEFTIKEIGLEQPSMVLAICTAGKFEELRKR